MFSGLKIGITPLITSQWGKQLITVVRHIPLQRLLLETDAPYFNVDVEASYGFSSPGQVAHTLAQIQAIRRKESLEEIMVETRRNAEEVYRIPMNKPYSSEEVIKTEIFIEEGSSGDDPQITPYDEERPHPIEVAVAANEISIGDIGIQEEEEAFTLGSNQAPVDQSRAGRRSSKCMTESPPEPGARIVQYDVSDQEEVFPVDKAKLRNRAKLVSESYLSSEISE